MPGLLTSNGSAQPIAIGLNALKGKDEQRLPRADELLKQLLKPDSGTSIYRVRFRDDDGSVGRRDYLTHWIHWYPAKMFHRIPQAILAALPEDLVILDPFCGSGTVLLEGILRGHTAIGIDVNPIARLITRVKTTPIDPLHLKSHLAGILNRMRHSTVDFRKDPALDYWFKQSVRRKLQSLFDAIVSMRHRECREFFEIAYSSIIRRVSLADPRIPPPVKLNAGRAKLANHKYKADFDFARNLRESDVLPMFTEAVHSNLRRMTELFGSGRLGTAEVLADSAEAARTGLPDGSVDLIMTSPPYCGAQKYVRSLRLEMLLMNMPSGAIADADRRTVGTERITRADILSCLKTGYSFVDDLVERVRRRNEVRATMLAQYAAYMNDFAKEIKRVLKENRHAFVTFGSDRVSGYDVNCAEIFVHAATANGLRHVATLVDSIPSRGMITKRHATAATIAEEYVVCLKS